jgi:predicted glycogen debranching enzyme
MNPAFRFDAETRGGLVRFQPYDGVPAILALGNGRFERAPDWYMSFLYEQETERGLDDIEDLGSPGVFHWDLDASEAMLILAAGTPAATDLIESIEPEALLARARAAERRRRRQPPLHRAADAYLIQRGPGRTIVAGYPWFGDWGRDTFISIGGLCLATGKIGEARDILLEWAGRVSEGMLPNRFTDENDTPEYNSVDASLWFVVAVQDYLAARLGSGRPAPARERKQLQSAVERILEGYSAGTRFGIRMDEDGLLAAGVPGLALTWMDAKAGDWVVTPRIGKPVEVQALWLNALRIGATFSERWDEIFLRGLTSFRARFWNEERGGLFDVVDVDHERGRVDPAFRPNQIFAVGGVPYPVLEGEQAARMVASVEERLWTPLGLRTLSPDETGYAPRYLGDRVTRDGAYHQGTVWPWLAGPFVEAWVRVRGGTPEAKAEARRRFLEPLLAQRDRAGLGHLPEIADADPPHTPRGCPFQAWSDAEALRLELKVLVEEGEVPTPAPDQASSAEAWRA